MYNNYTNLLATNQTLNKINAISLDNYKDAINAIDDSISELLKESENYEEKYVVS